MGTGGGTLRPRLIRQSSAIFIYRLRSSLWQYFTKLRACGQSHKAAEGGGGCEEHKGSDGTKEGRSQHSVPVTAGRTSISLGCLRTSGPRHASREECLHAGAAPPTRQLTAPGIIAVPKVAGPERQTQLMNEETESEVQATESHDLLELHLKLQLSECCVWTTQSTILFDLIVCCSCVV